MVIDGALADEIKALEKFFGQRFLRSGKDKHSLLVFSRKYGILESKPFKNHDGFLPDLEDCAVSVNGHTGQCFRTSASFVVYVLLCIYGGNKWKKSVSFPWWSTGG